MRGLFAAASACASVSAAAAPFVSGAAAWVYDVKDGEPAMWSSDIAAFNSRAKTPIDIVFSYGGDMEYYPALPQPYQTYFPPASQAEAAAYKATAGVKTVITVIDGRMDGGEDWSPDLSKLNASQLKAWADATADMYCSYDVVDGIQMDLEPFSGKYRAPFLVFLTELSANLRSAERNCVDAGHPNGRVITTFMFAADAAPDVWTALGPNGFLSVSGYDLSAAPAGTPSTVAAFSAALGAAVDTAVAAAAAHNGSFMVGIPGAASTHEFERFVWANGSVVEGHPQLQYAEAAVQVLAAAKAAGAQGYLGPALWGFSSDMDYPPHSNNAFFPGTPFASAGEEDFLAASL